MNLLSFPPEINDLIFQHLAVPDIRAASLASRRLNGIIGNSAIAMKNLRINKFDEFENFQLILSSNRRYQSITFLPEQSKLMKNTKYLRAIRDIIVNNSKSLIFLKISQDLKLRNVELPKLQVLELVMEYFQRKYVNFIVSNGLITTAPNLRKLVILFYMFDDKSLKYLRQTIFKHESIRILIIESPRIIEELDDDDIKLKLDEFYLLAFKGQDLVIFRQFFDSQMATLTSIEIPFEKNYITYFMSNFPKLSSLLILAGQSNFVYNLESETPEYPVNRTVTVLTLRSSFYSIDSQFIHASEIIEKMTNLQELYLQFFNLEMLDVLNNCPLLHVVKYVGIIGWHTQAQENQLRYHLRIRFIQITKEEFMSRCKTQ